MSYATDNNTQASTHAAGHIVMARLDELARFSAEPGALTRLYLSTEHKAAALQVQAWMHEAGMAAHIDPVGNVVGRYEGREPGLPALLLGSHIDTVRNAGKYDGCFGVMAAIQAVTALYAEGERLPFAVEVIAFGDEEGVRFPVTLTGSRAIAGTLNAAALDAKDTNGISIREALQQFGSNPFEIPSVSRRQAEVLGYVELHIEQGPVLEAEGLPVGVVTAIAGASRLMAEVAGTAGHSGTVPMVLRHDALAAAAEMILAVEQVGRSTEDLVATVGRVEAIPGAVNVIPGRTRFTIDVRCPSDAVRTAAIARIQRELEAIAVGRGVGLRLARSYDEAAATCAAWLIDQLSAAVARSGIKPRRLPSGAGHDGLAMVALCPTGMLFVRCAGGISHDPAEAMTNDDADIAVRVLIDFLRHFTPAHATADQISPEGPTA
ncbi:MAG: allantoate amidohydrolase [Acetobacteraceae bacterium]|nr:allantoate amidohydrolase [Acetobacteraceae bacterium]